MAYDFLIDTYETERVKVVSVWSEFSDEDLPVRPHRLDIEAVVCKSRWCISV